MFGNLMDKLESSKEDIKQKLDSIIVDGQAENGLVKVAANGNGEILQIFIDPSLFAQGDKEAVEDLVLTAVNRALKNANEAQARETQSLADDLLKGMF